MSESPRAALVTVAIGPEYQELAELTHHSFKRYADRLGLDLVVISEQTVGLHPVFSKLACYELLEQYERLIFVDADALISPECPNLLEIVPESSFGAYVVSRHTDFHDEAIILTQRSLRDFGWRRDYFNCGVLVVSRAHQSVFDRTDPDFPVFLQASQELGLFYEQTYINYKVYEKKIPLFDIGYKFNHTLAPGNSAERFGSHIVHCKGHRRGSKVGEVKRARYVLDRPRLRTLLVRFPRLTRIFDKL